MINSPTLLAALAPAPPSPPAGNTAWPRLPRRSLKRPRGLWKARRRLDASTAPSQQHQLLQTPTTTAASSSGRGSDTDREYDSEREMTMMMMTEESGGEGGSREEDDEEEEEDDTSQNSGSSKRQRRDSRSTGSCGSVELLWAAVYVDPNLTLSPSTNTNSSLTVDGHAAHEVAAESRPATGRSSGSGAAGGASPAAISDDADDDAAACLGRAAMRTTPAAVISKMITTSIAESVSREAEKKETFEYEDWEEIKETLTRASELCDRTCLLPSPLSRPITVTVKAHVCNL